MLQRDKLNNRMFLTHLQRSGYRSILCPKCEVFSDFRAFPKVHGSQRDGSGGRIMSGFIPFRMVGRITPPVIETPWPFGKGDSSSLQVPPPDHRQSHCQLLLEVLASHVHSSIKKVALTRCLFCAQILEGN